MVKKAIIQERKSQFDQEAVMHLLCEEKDKNQLNFFFREYKTASSKFTSSDEKDNSDGCTSSSQIDNSQEGNNLFPSGEQDSPISSGEKRQIYFIRQVN